MANLKNLSERIKSVTSIQQVTKAMKMVAAAKVKKAQEKMEISRPYSKSTQDLICRILPQISASDISLVEKRKVKNTGIIVITSDRGFAGSFNSSVIRLAEKEIEKILGQIKDGVVQPKSGVEYNVGEKVQVIDGPFASFNGLIEEIDEEKSRLKVSVSIFGRATPVDLEFNQVEKN